MRSGLLVRRRIGAAEEVRRRAGVTERLMDDRWNEMTQAVVVVE